LPTATITAHAGPALPRDADGVATAELAFTAPILPFVLLGVVDIGGT
jgi:Flp pilus assembly protein TadG